MKSLLLGMIAAVVFTLAAPLVPAQSVQAATSTQEVSVWWPKQNVTLRGTQPFKARLRGAELADYTMYWQVDGGRLNLMHDSQEDYPHKEVDVNVDAWNWKGEGPYTITFVAKDKKGKTLREHSVQVKSKVKTVKGTTKETAKATPSAVAPKPATTPAVPTPVVVSNPFSGATFYVDPKNDAAKQILAWQVTRPSDAKLLARIANQPDADWFGDWNDDIKADVDKKVTKLTAAGALPVLVAYNIADRDCGSYSAGGAASDEEYLTWIRNFAAGIGDRKAVVILEPDALGQTKCLTDARYATLKSAVQLLEAKKNVAVYLDAGHSNWIKADEMAARLKKAGVEHAQGFSLNVSNFHTTQSNLTYGEAVSQLVSGKHFVIDTGRNGAGSTGEWCNPQGVALGQTPTVHTGHPLADAFLWVKQPGGSDGTCNGGLSGGGWMPEYALMLVKNAMGSK